MSPTPYGVYAERAAGAFADLIRGPVLPQDPRFWPSILNSRDIMIGALRDRIRNQFEIEVKSSDPAARTPHRFDTLQRNPAIELAYVIEHLPRMAPAERIRPSDALVEFSDPVARIWVRAAKELLAANHTLNTAGTRPWRTERSANAALASDTAQIVEAIAVIDQPLRDAGVLDSHDVAYGVPPANLTTARLVASTVDRFAEWTAEHTATDLTFTPPARPPEFNRPVHMVQAPTDLAPAQGVLESFLRPMADRDLHGPYRLSAATALTVAHNQVNLVATLHHKVATSPGLAALVSRVERLQDKLDGTLYATRGLHDAAGPRIHAFVRGQQQEISVMIKRGHIDALSNHQTSDLLAATEATLGTWAAALLREIGRSNTDLRITQRGYIEEPIYGVIPPNSPAARDIAALAEYKPAIDAGPPAPSTRVRTQLRDALTQTPPFEIAETWPKPTRQHPERQLSSQQPAKPRHGPSR